MTFGGIFGGTHIFHTFGSNFHALNATSLLTADAALRASVGTVI
jgi:hypothetical protein